MRLPRRLSVWKTERQGLPILYHFASQDEVRSALFDFGTLNLNIFVGFESDAHLVEEALRTQEDLHRILLFVWAGFRQQVSDAFAARGRDQFQFTNGARNRGFGSRVVFGRSLGKHRRSNERKGYKSRTRLRTWTERIIVDPPCGEC